MNLVCLYCLKSEKRLKLKLREFKLIINPLSNRINQEISKTSKHLEGCQTNMHIASEGLLENFTCSLRDIFYTEIIILIPNSFRFP